MSLRKVKMSCRCGKKGASLNHHLFMDNLNYSGKSEKLIEFLIKAVQKCGRDISMEFWITEFAVLNIKKVGMGHG